MIYSLQPWWIQTNWPSGPWLIIYYCYYIIYFPSRRLFPKRLTLLTVSHFFPICTAGYLPVQTSVLRGTNSRFPPGTRQMCTKQFLIPSRSRFPFSRLQVGYFQWSSLFIWNIASQSYLEKVLECHPTVRTSHHLHPQQYKMHGCPESSSLKASRQEACSETWSTWLFSSWNPQVSNSMYQCFASPSLPKHTSDTFSFWTLRWFPFSSFTVIN